MSMKKLRAKVVQNFNEQEGLSFANWKEVRSYHWARNDNQPEVVDYLDVLLGDYKLVAKAQSVFHQLNRFELGETGNQDNTKWVSRDGRQEYVFRYDNTIAGGQFELLTFSDGINGATHQSHLNVGTYNFGTGLRKHGKLDVDPWLLWGNSKEDAMQWTYAEREDAFQPVQGAISLVAEKFGGFVVFGTPLSNTLSGNERTQTFRGGLGSDTVEFEPLGGPVTVNLDKKKGYDGDARGDKFISIENITGTMMGDILIGDKKANRLDGFMGNDTIVTMHNRADTIIGGSGNDTVIVKAGLNHWIDGGTGDDVLDLRDVNARRVDFSRIEDFEEVLTDQVFLSDNGGLAGASVEVSGTHRFKVDAGESLFLMAGAEITLAHGARIEIAFKFDQPEGFKKQDLLTRGLDRSFDSGVSRPWEGSWSKTRLAEIEDDNFDFTSTAYRQAHYIDPKQLTNGFQTLNREFKVDLDLRDYGNAEQIQILTEATVGGSASGEADLMSLYGGYNALGFGLPLTPYQSTLRTSLNFDLANGSAEFLVGDTATDLTLIIM